MFEGGQISEGGDKFPRKFGPGGTNFPGNLARGDKFLGGTYFLWHRPTAWTGNAIPFPNYPIIVNNVQNKSHVYLKVINENINCKT